MDFWFYFLILIAGMAGVASRDLIGWWRTRSRWTCPECNIRISTKKKESLRFVQTEHMKDHPKGEIILIGMDQYDLAYTASRHEGVKFYKQVSNNTHSLRHLEGLRIKTVYLTPYVLEQGLDESLLALIHSDAFRMGRTLEQTIRVLG